MSLNSTLMPLCLMAWITTLSGCAATQLSSSEVELYNSQQRASSTVEPPPDNDESVSETPVDSGMRRMARIYGTIENFEVVRDATTGWMSLRGAGHQPKFAAMSSSASAAVRSLLTEPRYFSHRPTRPRFFVAEVRYRFTREAHTVDVHVNRSTRSVEVHVGGEVVGRGVLGDHRKIDWVLDAAELWQRPKVTTCNVGETDPTVGTLLLRQLERDSGLASRIDEPAGRTRLAE